MLQGKAKDYSDQWLVAEQYFKDNFSQQINCELSELKSQRDEMLAMLEYLIEKKFLSNDGKILVENLIKKVKNE